MTEDGHYTGRLLEFTGGLILGIIVMYVSYVLRANIPMMWHIRVDTPAEIVAILSLASLGILCLLRKRYAALIGLLLSYPFSYLMFLLLFGIACSKGNFF
jgi:hypothetical protein